MKTPMLIYFVSTIVKSFTTLTDAERFMAGEDRSNNGLSEVAGAESKFYAVRSGRVPGIYTDWPSAQKQIVGWTKPKQKCFSTRAEAQRFMGEADKGTSGESTEDSENQVRAGSLRAWWVRTSTNSNVRVHRNRRKSLWLPTAEVRSPNR